MSNEKEWLETQIENRMYAFDEYIRGAVDRLSQEDVVKMGKSLLCKSIKRGSNLHSQIIYWNIVQEHMKIVIHIFRQSKKNIDFLMDKQIVLDCLKNVSPDLKTEYLKEYRMYIVPLISQYYRDTYRIPNLPMEMKESIQSFVTGPRMGWKARKSPKKSK